MTPLITGHPPPLTPEENVYHTRMHFREKGVFFQWTARIRESKKKGHFSGMS